MHTGSQLKGLPRKFFAPSWKNVLNIFKNIGHSLKHLSSSQKTLRPPVSQAVYGPVYTIMSVERGWVEGGLGKI